jgi:hypothetical protein
MNKTWLVGGKSNSAGNSQKILFTIFIDIYESHIIDVKQYNNKVDCQICCSMFPVGYLNSHMDNNDAINRCNLKNLCPSLSLFDKKYFIGLLLDVFDYNI